MYKLIISIVPHDSGEIITNAAKSAGAAGGSIVMGRGTASNSIIQLLGLGDTSKDITYNVVTDQDSKKVCEAIIAACAEKKSHFGVMFSIDVSGFAKAGNMKSIAQGESTQEGETKMNSEYEMINIIVNKGYADDAMAAARKAGAGGGTIISARGTAKEGDGTFFGVEIVPEKDMLMILVPAEKKQAILEAVAGLECFAKAGSGVIFCNQAQDFTLLGKN